jgi:hypothetical protein
VADSSSPELLLALGPAVASFVHSCDTPPRHPSLAGHVEPGAFRTGLLRPGAALQTRLWDRVADGYVSTPVQRIVGDVLRPRDAKDPHGVSQAHATLELAYSTLDRQLRVLTRPSVARALDEARPYRELFPLPWPEHVS